MAQSSRTFRNLAACILVLSCLGGVWWLLLPEGTEDPVAAVVQMAENLTGGSGEADSAGTQTSGAGDKSAGAAQTAAQEEAKSGSAAEGAAGTETASASSAAEEGKETSGRIAESAGPQEVSAALGSGGAPAAADPEAELLARVEKAMQQNGTALPGGDSVSGAVENRPPQPGEVRQDSVVTAGFVRDMGSWLASGYVPPRKEGEKGRTSRTIVNANFRYSTSGTLRSAERDPLKGRAGILNYVFSSGMMEALFRMYSPSLLEEMERAARDEKRRVPLDDAHVADMFMVYAEAFHRLGTSLEAASGVDLAALSATVHREAAREAAANDDFARAYTALSLAREHGRSDEVAIQSRRMAESTRIAGMYADRQERARNDMVYAIRRNASDKTLSSAELLFLGEWLSRRHASPEAVHTAGDICLRTAELMQQRAERILHPESAPAEAAAPAQESAVPATAAVKEAEPKKASPDVSTGKGRVSFADRSSSGTEAYGKLVKEPAAEAPKAAGEQSSGASAPAVSAAAPAETPAPVAPAAGTAAPAASVPAAASPVTPAPSAAESAPASAAAASAATPVEPVPAVGSSESAAPGSSAVSTPAASSATPAAAPVTASGTPAPSSAAPAVPAPASAASVPAAEQNVVAPAPEVAATPAANSNVSSAPAVSAATPAASAETPAPAAPASGTSSPATSGSFQTATSPSTPALATAESASAPAAAASAATPVEPVPAADAK